MGNKHGSNTVKLSTKIEELATSIFREIDVDGSGTIEVEETANWWKNNFAKINSRAMFETVDRDHNGMIDFDEWIQFWTNVKNHGHTDEELEEELINIKEGGSWVQFEDCPKTHATRKD